MTDYDFPEITYSPKREETGIKVIFDDEPAKAKKKMLQALPERQYTAPEDTASWKLLGSIGKFKAGSFITVTAVTVCVLLGLVCVIRYASIFDLTRHTRRIENENAKARSKLAAEQNSLSVGSGESVDEIAARLGMIHPSEENQIRIERGDENVTMVHLAGDDQPSDADDEGFFRNLMDFLGRVDYD